MAVNEPSLRVQDCFSVPEQKKCCENCMKVCHGNGSASCGVILVLFMAAMHT